MARPSRVELEHPASYLRKERNSGWHTYGQALPLQGLVRRVSAAVGRQKRVKDAGLHACRPQHSANDSLFLTGVL